MKLKTQFYKLVERFGYKPFIVAFILVIMVIVMIAVTNTGVIY